MKQAVTGIPVTAKIRLGWSEDARNYLDQAKAAADGGADAIFVHGRTRNARYRQAADWDAIGEVVAAVPVPVVGNGDILFPHDIEAARARSGCAGVMAGRGALIKPWLFREATAGLLGHHGRRAARPSTGATSTWRASTGARTTTAWRGCASSCAGTSGSGAATRRGAPTARGPALQTREPMTFVRSPLEALLARGDDAALDWLADRLVRREEIVPADAPPPGDARRARARRMRGPAGSARRM